MKHFLLIFLILFNSINIFSQHYFNIVLPSNENCIEGIYHPAFEISDSNICFVTSTIFRNQYGGTASKSILNNKGVLLINERLQDSINTTVPYDLIKVGDHFIASGIKFIAIDTLYELWMAIINIEGTIIYEKQHKTNYNRPAYLKSIALKKNGRFAFAGTNDLFEQGVGGASITSTGLVIITDSLGVIEHYIEYNDLDTNTLEGYYGITEDADGNIYACGVIKPPGFNYDAIIVKVSPEGRLLWRKRIPSQEYSEILNAAYPQNDGSLLFIGTSFDPYFSGGEFSYVLLMNMDSNGLVNWTKRIYYGYENYNASTVLDKHGNIICGGTFTKSSSSKADGWICKFTPKGDTLWSRPISKFNKLSEQFFNIATASDGGYYLTGYSWIDGDNSSKAWIVKTDSFGCLVPGCEKVVATEDIQSGKEKAFVMYPNPVTNKFYFLSRIEDVDLYRLLIYDLQGQILQTYPFNPSIGTQYEVELNTEIVSGNYLVQIQNTKGYIVHVEKMEVLK